MVGISDGNGHPYSWSIAFNGYNKKEIYKTKFKNIAQYLENYSFPKFCINGAKVTHIWTQNLKLSKSISRSALIPNVCKNLEDLTKAVDAIIFARDDYQSRNKYLPKLLQSGKPIFVDKPIHLNVKSLNKLLKMQKFPGQIYSCSTFCHDINFKSLKKNALSKIGKLKKIYAYAPKSWNTYGVHLVDPVIREFCKNDKIVKNIFFRNKFGNFSKVVCKSGLEMNFTTYPKETIDISMDFVGTKGIKKIIWRNHFNSFKNSLEYFLQNIKYKKYTNENEHHKKVVQILEKGFSL